MAEEKRPARGGFRATLALLLSIVALILAIMAFTRSGGEADFDARMKELQTKIESMKEETSKKLDKVREETAGTLDRISKSIKKKETESP
jgi:hypothetical protein